MTARRWVPRREPALPTSLEVIEEVVEAVREAAEKMIW